MSFKVLDFRQECYALQTIRKHDAGVTCLVELDEHTILTGGYDCNLKLWDRRGPYKEVESLNTGKQIWDVKLNHTEGPYALSIGRICRDIQCK